MKTPRAGKAAVLLIISIILITCTTGCGVDSSKGDTKENGAQVVASVSQGSTEKDIQTAYEMIDQNVAFGELKVTDDKYDFDIVVEFETFNKDGQSEVKELYRIPAKTLNSETKDGKLYKMTVGQDYTTWSGQLLLPDAVVYFSPSPSLVKPNAEDIAQVMDFLDSDLAMNRATRAVRLAFVDQNEYSTENDEVGDKEDEGHDGRAIAYIRFKPVPKDKLAQ